MRLAGGCGVWSPHTLCAPARPNTYPQLFFQPQLLSNRRRHILRVDPVAATGRRSSVQYLRGCLHAGQEASTHDHAAPRLPCQHRQLPVQCLVVRCVRQEGHAQLLALPGLNTDLTVESAGRQGNMRESLVILLGPLGEPPRAHSAQVTLNSACCYTSCAPLPSAKNLSLCAPGCSVVGGRGGSAMSLRE